MNVYKVKTVVKNGQLIVDLPFDFDKKTVEITVALVDEKDPINAQYNRFSNDTQLVEESEEISYIASNPQKSNPTEHQDTALVDEFGFIPPRQKIDLRALRGAFKHKMTIEEIDSLTKSWRDEWDRDFS